MGRNRWTSRLIRRALDRSGTRRMRRRIRRFTLTSSARDNRRACLAVDDGSDC